MKYLKIQLLLVMLLVNIWTVSGQNTIRDSVYYTHKQDVRCLICLVNEQRKDSIILEQSNFIEFQDSTIIELTYLNATKTKRNKRNAYIFGGGGFGLGVFLTWLLLK